MNTGLCRTEYVSIVDIADIGQHEEVLSRTIRLLCRLSAPGISALSEDDCDALHRTLAIAGMSARELAMIRGSKIEATEEALEVQDMLLSSCALIRLSGFHLSEQSVRDYLSDLEELLGIRISGG